MADFDPYQYQAKPNENFDPYSMGGQLHDQGAAQELIQKANEPDTSNQQRIPQLQEEYANPTEWPGFENLSKKEQLERIAFSQWDPANLGPTGLPTRPGYYENPINRIALTTIPTLAQPEIGLGESTIGRLLQPFVNSLMRIGTGTGANVAAQLPEVQSKEDLKNLFSQSALINSLLEIPGLSVRGASGLAEKVNPLNYTKNKAEQIKNEFASAKSLEQQKYQPVMNNYGQMSVSKNPTVDLAYPKNMIKYFTPDLRLNYDKLLDKPNLQNLHDFQSQAGRDYAKVANNPNKINKAQTLNAVRKDALQKIYDFLGQDKNALNLYQQGMQIRRDLVGPYESHAILRQVINGLKPNIKPAELSDAITKGTEKLAYKKGGNVIAAIPENHPLRNHLTDLNERINFGNMLKDITPEIIKKWTINYPGLVQNPLVQSIFRNVSPFYYGLGRAGAALMNQQKENKE